MNHRISAGMFVVHEGRILMVRHNITGQYDLWVTPGGGVQGLETLEEAAKREVFEETSIRAEVEHLLYIEEFYLAEARHCKFWFWGRFVEGEISVAAPEAQSEFIVEAAWLDRTELEGREFYPTFLLDKPWQDLASKANFPQYCGLRK
ncbi:MAG: NUDIX domain-containing protein [Candidatus Kapaibacteriota bacterium]|jgi:8-oxo-dGTP diphosphatase